MNELLHKLALELDEECRHILAYWMDNTIDTVHGGFVGKIDNNGTIDIHAPKGLVLNSRILYTFSAAAHKYNSKKYEEVATLAYRYIQSFFVDKEFGGVYWTVDHRCQPLDTKKQVYAIAFALYGMSEYYSATGLEQAKETAIELYSAIEKHSHDKERKGYCEAFSREWNELPDMRLSTKDVNEKKSMNTHLHVLEAYANLYKIWPSEGLRQNIIELVKLFLNHIIDPLTNHLILFFDEEWNSRSSIISYGHDIEAAWLVQEAAEVIQDEVLINMLKYRSIKIADAAARGLDGDGGLWYEKDVAANHLIKQKHWWPQAEAIVGFFNAWQITANDRYLQYAVKAWDFVKSKLIDKQHGEWFWGINEGGSVMTDDKVGLWKCPYHNARACMEIVKRIRLTESCDS